MAMIAAASMTQESGFHMNPKNLRILLSCDHQNTKFKQSLHVRSWQFDTTRVSRKRVIRPPSPRACWGQRFQGAAAPAGWRDPRGCISDSRTPPQVGSSPAEMISSTSWVTQFHTSTTQLMSWATPSLNCNKLQVWPESDSSRNMSMSLRRNKPWTQRTKWSSE